MKSLMQIIGVLVLSVNTLQIILTLGTAIVMLKLLADNLREVRDRSENRRRRKAFDKNMWAID